MNPVDRRVLLEPPRSPQRGSDRQVVTPGGSTTRLHGLGAYLLLASCAPSAELFLDRPWPEDEAAVLVATHEGEVVAVQLISPGVHTFTFEAPDPIEIHARTYAVLADLSTGDCAITMGSAGVELGAPTGAWRGTVDAGRDTLSLEVEPDPVSFDLRAVGCGDPVASCELDAVALAAPPSYVGLVRVAALSDRAAIACGTQRSAADPETLLVRIEDDSVDVLPPIGVTGLCSGLALHGDLVAGAAGSTLFFLDASGARVSTAAAGLAVSELTSGADGTFAIGHGGRLVRLNAGEREPIAFDGPSFSPGAERPKLDVASATRLGVIAPDGDLYLYNRGWRSELDAVISFDTFAIDDDAVLAVPEAESMLLLATGAIEWIPVGQPFLANRAISATSLGGGRFLVGGQNGRASYYNGQQACDIFTPTDRNIEDIDFAPGAQAGFAVGENEGPDTPPMVLRFTLP